MKATVLTVIVSCMFANAARAQNFYELSGKQYCESVMDKFRSDCVSLNAKKDASCREKGACDLEKHIAKIQDYKAALEQLNSGKIADADRSSFQDSIDKMKAELDANKNAAETYERAARACADARQDVYDFFDKTVIPETDRAASNAKDRRKELLEQLDKAEVLQRAAKDKRDSLSDSDPQKAQMQEEYEKNAAAYREAEAQLAEFNRTYGNDIDSGVRRLIDYYKTQQSGHRIAIEQQKDRSESCGKVEYMSY